jgi:hypothetical protein
MSLQATRAQPDRAVEGTVWGTRAFWWLRAHSGRALGGVLGARGPGAGV